MDVTNSANKKNLQEGIILEALPSTTFKVKLKGSEQEILAHLSGKMRINYIRILPGDKVLVEVGIDGRRGRITRRL
ncbi:MAG: translation initiation factor IF-1 [Patescibacteria group bacterium]|nr:translation initiation factor IF-1 [Patescibacteria group bacterium]